MDQAPWKDRKKTAIPDMVSKWDCETPTYDWGKMTTWQDGEFIRCANLPDRDRVEEDLFNYHELQRSAQQFGPAIEHQISLLCGFEKISAKEGTGDLRAPFGIVENKGSLTKDGKVSGQQLRITRAIDYYCFVIYAARFDYLYLGFVPSYIIKRVAGSQSHGTASLVEGNKDREVGLKNVYVGPKGLSPNLAILDRYNYFGGGADLVTTLD